MENEFDNFFPDTEERESEFCPTCQGNGCVPVADGHNEYMGYSYEACPDCEKGIEWYSRNGQMI